MRPQQEELLDLCKALVPASMHMSSVMPRTIAQAKAQLCLTCKLRTPSYFSMLRVQSIPPAYVPRGLACNLTLTVSNGNPVNMLAAPATPPLSALIVPSDLPGPIRL